VAGRRCRYPAVSVDSPTSTFCAIFNARLCRNASTHRITISVGNTYSVRFVNEHKRSFVCTQSSLATSFFFSLVFFFFFFSFWVFVALSCRFVSYPIFHCFSTPSKCRKVWVRLVLSTAQRIHLTVGLFGHKRKRRFLARLPGSTMRSYRFILLH
jgi:hypothetical protein